MKTTRKVLFTLALTLIVGFFFAKMATTTAKVSAAMESDPAEHTSVVSSEVESVTEDAETSSASSSSSSESSVVSEEVIEEIVVSDDDEGVEEIYVEPEYVEEEDTTSDFIPAPTPTPTPVTSETDEKIDVILLIPTPKPEDLIVDVTVNGNTETSEDPIPEGFESLVESEVESEEESATTTTESEADESTTSSVPVEEVVEHEHTWTAEKVVSATCLSGGYTVYSCVCGEVYNGDETEMLAHSYQDTVVEPTETSEGYTLHVCMGCGDNYKDNITPVVVIEEPVLIVDPETGHTHKETDLHAVKLVGGYTYIYCMSIETPYKDGHIIYYPYEYYF